MTESAWRAYRALGSLVDAEIARDLERQSGLSMADYEVLAAVAELWSPESCVRVRALTDHMGWSHPRLSRQLSRMQQRGLIGRESCHLDGRGDDVVLTDVGRAAYDAATPAHHDSIRRHFTGLLTAEQLAALADIGRTITAAKRP